VIFTSGSTGKPKGVMIDHRGALNTIADVNHRFAVGLEDRVLALSALSFDLSVYDVFGLLAAGGTIVIPEAEHLRDPGRWLDLLSLHQVTLWNSVPALLEMLVEYCAGRGAKLPRSLRQVLLSGDWIPVSLPARVRALSPELALCSLGGATEASIWSIAYPIEQVDPSWKSIPYGKPLTNQTFHVFDKQLAPTPEWVAGELYIGGVGVALGYIGDEPRTEERFRVHPELDERLYWTGDLGRYLPDGNIEFLGRADLQVKIQGYRIELEEIEAALLSCEGVQAAAVLAEAAVSGGKRLVAYVAAEPGRQPSADALRALLSSRLPSYMLPATFCFLERLPLTHNGKIDRLRLAQTASRPAPAAVRGSSELAASFLQLCRELLQRPELDRQDNFFLSGGDSLLATRLSSRLREAHGIELKLEYVFDHPQIGELLLEIERLERERQGAPRAPHAQPLVASASEAALPFPLTDVQYAYWLGRSRAFALGGVACQGYVELDCEALDVERLQRALSRLVERHPMLRAVVDDSARQRVLAAVSVAVPVRDLRALSPAEQATALAEERERWSHAILPSDRAPLFRMAVTRLSESRSRVHWNVDLLILDYFSFKIVARELRALYESPARDLPPIGLSFRDYGVHQKRQEESAEYRASLTYWQARARELPPAPALPLARQPSELSRVRFRRRRADLPKPRWQALRALASRWQLSASSLLLAAFAETLARHCREPRFTLNVTLFDRAAIHPDVERVVGDFTTVTLLGVDWRGQSFVERARALQRQLWRDLDHRRVSGVRVLGELAHSRGGSASAMPVVFTSTLRNESAAEQAPLAWLGEEAFAVSQTPQVWLDHQLGEDEHGLFLLWDAVEELFPEGFLDSMFESYLGLLNALADGLSEADGAGFSEAVTTAPAGPALAAPLSAVTPEESLDKLQFKLERRGLRRDLSATPLPLVRPELGAARQRELGLRRSFRQFVQDAVPSERLSALLSSLIQEQIPGLPFPKSLYGSAGGLYPVQLYCSIKPGRVRGLEGGSYYYDPDAHALVQLGRGNVPADLYPAVNAPLFQQAAFSLFLIADRLAIEPAYGAYWRDFALLEAGAICQLLESRAADQDLGLCQTGAVPFERVRADFGLHDPRYVYLHGLLGGGVRPEQQTLAGLIAELSPLNASLSERARPKLPELAKLTPVASDSSLETRLLALWSELLQRDDLSPDAHFFEVGGSSLLVVQLANRIREELGQEIPVLLLFEQPTVALQAAYLRAEKSGRSPAPALQHPPSATEPAPSNPEHAGDQQRRERLRRARLDLD
jgi:SagB-type dehydrogenase family enzyme